MAKVFFIFFTVISLNSVKGFIEYEVPRNALDLELYENVLDEELCEAQLSYIRNNSTMLRAQFLDAGIRTPRGILKGNFVDLGNYHQCIEISANFEPSNVEGKYCMINIPIVQDDLELPTLPEWPEEWPEGWPEWPEEWPEFPWPELLPNTRQHRDMMRSIQKVRVETAKYSRLAGLDTDLMRISEDSSMANEAFRLAVCLPKACTPKQFIDGILINTTAVGLQFTEEFCRLNNDKPFVPGDYAAMGVFGFIIIITILCTSYDLYYTHILKGDPKRANVLGKSFSVYTNTRRLLTFNSVPGTLECLDGIRALAMMWVILGHTYSTHLRAPFFNRTDFFAWMTSFPAIWIMSAPITVDTFFMLSGLLIVYTSVGKMSRMSLIRNLHLFYLHRLLRMFPILATGIFLQASLFNHLSDGPQWYIVVDKVERCRAYWWSTFTYLQTYLTKTWVMGLLKNIHFFYLHRLLRMFPVLAAGVFLQATLFNHLSDGPRWNDIMVHKVHKCRQFWWATLLHAQNFITPLNQCVGPTWYLAVDIQMHILSPLVLFWVLGKKRSAWIALTLAMLTIMVISTTYNYVNEFQPAPFVPSRTDDDYQHYMRYYYVNTLPRCSPFFVGMLFGYLLHVFKGKEVRMPKWFVVLGWAKAFMVSAGIIYSTYPVLQMDWNSPFLDGIINSFTRPGWAACLGWMIFACTHGYGGPINWLLSLKMWKLPARISFAMYIFHYPVMHVVNATSVSPTEFTVMRYFYRFVAEFSSAFVIGFIVTVLIDSPFSTLIKLVMGGGPKRAKPEKVEPREDVGAIDPAVARDYARQISKTKL